ncbi:MAG: hypothetical protein R2734_05755 [Nocardioides sp.]
MRSCWPWAGTPCPTPTGAPGRDQIAAAQNHGRRRRPAHPAAPVDVVITGNGPQVEQPAGEERAGRRGRPPCRAGLVRRADTQATLGFILMNALDQALAARGTARPSAPRS